MGTFVLLLCLSAGVWLSGYGAAMAIGQHGRYVSLSKRCARALGQLGVRGISWAWGRYRTQITWMAVGFFLALFLLGPMACN